MPERESQPQRAKPTPQETGSRAETPAKATKRTAKTQTGRERAQPPTKGARIIELARREGITLAEIAEAVDTSPSTVTTLLSEARKKDPTIPMLITPEAKQAPLASFRAAEHEEARNRQQQAIQFETELFSQAEIALLLGVSERTVRRYLQPPGPSGRTRVDNDARAREVWRLRRTYPDWNNAQIGRQAGGLGRSAVGKILSRPEPPPRKRTRKKAE